MAYILSKNCIIVNGATNSLICDLQKQKIHFIGPQCREIISNNDKLTKAILNNEFDDFNWLNTLLENEVIIEIPDDDVSLFIDLPIIFDVPSRIYNAILDRDPEVSPDAIKICKELHELRCRAVEVRYYKNFNSADLLSILNAFEDTTIEMINLYIPFDLESIEGVKNMVEQYVRISSVFIHSVPEKCEEIPDVNSPKFVSTTQIIDNNSHCGVISPFYFSINIPTFSEAKNYNSCLYKKIGIDIHGNIKNCPSMSLSFGNIKDTSLIDVVKLEEFQRMGSITKDNTKTCKDCEFRYVCTDCRAFLEEPEDALSKPLKCGYDPYTGFWEDWEKMPTKLEAINHYQIKF